MAQHSCPSPQRMGAERFRGALSTHSSVETARAPPPPECVCINKEKKKLVNMCSHTGAEGGKEAGRREGGREEEGRRGGREGGRKGNRSRIDGGRARDLVCGRGGRTISWSLMLCASELALSYARSCMRQHTSAYVSIHQHTWSLMLCVSIRQHT